MKRAPLTLARPLAAVAFLAVAAACSDDAATAPPLNTVHPMGAVHEDEALVEGATYVANLHPLNARVQNALDPDPRTPRGVARGKAYFRVVEGELRAVVNVSGAEAADGEAFPEGLHAQHIHAADRCPPMSADANGDGIVDVLEGVPFYGPILVPLDGQIGNTTSEIPSFPVAMGPFGRYDYEAAAPLATLIDAIGEPLDLANRHVVIHGVDLDTPLPATVQTLGGLPPQITLPVACGELRRAG